MKLEVAASSHTGLIRSQNEDSLLVRPEKRLFAVADGMGGHVAGEIASALAVAALDDAVSTTTAAADSPQALAARLLAGMRNANERILERGRAEPETRGMGTTLTAIAFPRGATSCALAHVGDSRAYRLRDGRLDLLTRDHTWVQDQVDAGRLDPEQARVHPYANVLSRVLGLPALDLVETTIIEVKPHDVLLLCSDGLTAMLEEENIQAILHAQPDLQAAAAQLIDTANAHGGVDNVTVVLIRALDGATGA